MSAAFLGNLVEKNIKLSSLTATLCFTIGMVGTGLVINNFKGTVALIGIYLFYGCIMGVGLGIGYLTPVKTLMLWFSEQKGLATGISIMGFGLAKAIATPIMEFLQNKYGISAMFYILASLYFVMMLLGHILIKKPEWWSENTIEKEKFNLKELLTNKTFIGIWIVFYFNIHCGLMLITYEKQILTYAAVGLSVAALMRIVSIVPSVTAGCNALGRLGYSTISDKLSDRATIYVIIFSSCAIVSSLSNLILSIVMIIILLMVVNLGYGGGFSTLPALLSQRFGMDNISKIHGIALSAWAVAGLTGNNTTALILKFNGNYNIVFAIAMIIYVISLLITQIVIKNKR
jgi:OFA family oxalate/formate antiporter-like MFS transporter